MRAERSNFACVRCVRADHASPSCLRARAPRPVDRRRRRVRAARGGSATRAARPGGRLPARLPAAEEQLELRERREQRAAGARGRGEAERPSASGARARGARRGRPAAPRKGPEPIGELMQIQNESGRRARGGQAGVKTGAYASAVARREADRDARPARCPARPATWTPAGKGPLIGDDKRYDEVNGQGLADQNGRPSDFAFDPQGRRLYAAVGEGGVWVADEKAGFNDWRSIGETLPTQAVGGIDFSPADGGTVIVSTGDNVFGGGGTFSGLGVFRTTDGGRSWQRASGVPDGDHHLQGRGRPDEPAASSTRPPARASSAPTDARRLVRQRQPADGPGRRARASPNCTGAAPDKEGCALANMVTDVVVQGPRNDKTAGARARLRRRRRRLARRATSRARPPRASRAATSRRPATASTAPATGAPGSFSKVDTSARACPSARRTASPSRSRIGRVELGEADRRPTQDHNYLYAIVEDAERFRGGIGAIDIPEEETGPVPGNTVLNGIYVSPDFGKTWTRMADAEQLKDPTSGSALTGTACATLYCPGVQAWYNLQIAPDPTRQDAAGVPTRMVFGLEEVWKNQVDGPLNGPTAVRRRRPVLRRRHLPVPQHRPAGLPDHAPAPAAPTTHPDQHASIWIPQADGGGHARRRQRRRRLRRRSAARGAALSRRPLGPRRQPRLQHAAALRRPDREGRHDLRRPAGQRRAEDRARRHARSRSTAATAPSAPSTPTTRRSPTSPTRSTRSPRPTDGGETWSAAAPPEDTLPVHQPVHDGPGATPSHLITAGNKVWETTNGAGEWKEVFDLGTRTKPGDAGAAAGDDDPDNSMSAIDVRGLGQALPVGRQDARTSTSTARRRRPVPGGGTDAPGTFVGQGRSRSGRTRATRKATIEVTWDERRQRLGPASCSARRAISSSRPARPARARRPRRRRSCSAAPKPGDYVIRVRNFAATRRLQGHRALRGRGAGRHRRRPQRRLRRLLRLLRRAHHAAVRERHRDQRRARRRRSARPAPRDGWHVAAARRACPKRYITSVQIDPADVAHGLRDARRLLAPLAEAGRARRGRRPGRRQRLQVHRRGRDVPRHLAATCPTSRPTGRWCATGSCSWPPTSACSSPRTRTAAATRRSAPGCRPRRCSRSSSSRGDRPSPTR